MSTLIHSTREALEPLADSDYLAQIQRLVPGIRTVGVRVPDLKKIAGELWKSKPQLADAVALLDAASESGVRDEFLVGVFLVARFKSQLRDLEWKLFSRWLKAVDNWEACDQLAGIAAPWLDADLHRTKHFFALTASKRVWDRRFPLAVGASINQHGRSNPGVTLSFCESLLEDPEPMVKKALAWAIREASEKDEPAVFAFLQKHRGRMQKTVLRESAEKLTANHRASFDE